MAWNAGFDYRERLGSACEGRSLLDHLASCYPHSSRETWRERVASGLVRLDGAVVEPDARLYTGQLLTWHRPAWEEPEAPRTFAILHEDDALLGVAKPAGLPTLPGAGFLEATLLHQVRRYARSASPLHRLGRFTSGVVVFSRDGAAHRALSRMWASREVVKRYRALVRGAPEWNERAIDVAIGPVAHGMLGTVHAASPDGKPATSRVVVLERRGDCSLCDVFIETGRPHQIRIHLAAAGHPLAGDPLYAAGGMPVPGTTALPGDPGYLLHAAEVVFRHPRTALETTIACAPPPTLRTSRTP